MVAWLVGHSKLQERVKRLTAQDYGFKGCIHSGRFIKTVGLWLLVHLCEITVGFLIACSNGYGLLRIPLTFCVLSDHDTVKNLLLFTWFISLLHEQQNNNGCTTLEALCGSILRKILPGKLVSRQTVDSISTADSYLQNITCCVVAILK